MSDKFGELMLKVGGDIRKLDLAGHKKDTILTRQSYRTGWHIVRLTGSHNLVAHLCCERDSSLVEIVKVKRTSHSE